VRGQFQRYQGVGPRLVSDSNDPAQKGKLSLLYRPSLRADDFKTDAYYRLEFGFPGAVQNDTAVPILVHARESTPILQAAYPARTHAGANMTLDATGSYNTQHTPLQFTWRQTGGVQINYPTPCGQNYLRRADALCTGGGLGGALPRPDEASQISVYPPARTGYHS